MSSGRDIDRICALIEDVDICCFANDPTVSAEEPEVSDVDRADEGGEGADFVANGEVLVGDTEAE